jgi:PAS domain S-box-containing protein
MKLRPHPSSSLAETFLQQSPACNWIALEDGTFHQIWGDPAPIFGRTADELMGRTTADTVNPDLAAAWKSRYDRVFQGETLHLRERHRESLWNFSVFPIRLQGEFRYAGCIAREVTPWGTAEQELRHTVLGALKAMEFERGVLSRFLHDSVGQNLTALGLQLDLMRMDLETVSPVTCAKIAEMQKILEQIMEEVREYSYELNPSAVDRIGLRTALDRMVDRFCKRFRGGLRLNVDPSLKFSPSVASALFHIAQEAVENAVQHAGCSLIEIAVKSSRTGVFLEVRDNGKGFDPAELLGVGRGLGLLSMEHYAAEAGLELSISSNRETGTVIKATAIETV